ncbi:hypothetical protein B0A52_01915 [Exophiala mesophila]|uniref:Pyruvate decarboxylase n=1 Tax=Exophiala mesophila TaxID=212818 RepID=A0A438NEC5_EXOME|nr:hypothetical protein B0A52_01915 [Exophiala mesophila]
MESHRIPLGGYIFQRIRSLGIKSIFGCPGDYNLNLLDHLYPVEGLKWIGTCNELNAAYAADGYARTRGLPGVLVTTYGVGELSAINGIGGARSERLQQPLDLGIRSPAGEKAEDVVVQKIIAQIEQAKRPCLLVDMLTQRFGLTGVVSEILDTTKLPVFVTPLAKSMVDETRDNFQGVYQGIITPSKQVKADFESADLTIHVGRFPSDSNCGGFTQKFGGDVIGLHPHYVSVGKEKFDGVSFVGVVQKLSLKLASRSLNIAQTSWCKSTKQTVASPELEKLQGQLTQAHIWKFFNQILRPGDSVIAEVGTSQFATVGMSLPRDCQYFTQMFYSCIGFTVGATLGTLVAREEMQKPGRVFLFVGDGSLQMTVQEISTMVRNGYRPIIVVINNEGYTVERVIHGPAKIHNDIAPWDHQVMLSFFGGRGKSKSYSARTYADLRQVLSHPDFQEGKQIQMLECHLHKYDSPENLLEIVDTATVVAAKTQKFFDQKAGRTRLELDDRLLALLESRVDQNHFGDSISSFDLSATMQPDLMPPPSVSRVDSPPNYHLDHDLGSINAQQGGTSVMITDHSFWNSIMSPGQPVAHPDQFLDNAHFSNDGVPGNLSDLSMELDMPHAGSSMSSQDESLTALQSSLLPANSPASSIPETNIPYDDLLQLYFEKIQPFLPMFHRPNFEQEFRGKINNLSLSTSSTSRESAFVLNAMFALSARFSSADAFSDRGRTARGEPFARRAEHLLENHNSSAIGQSSLRILQGCILLACYRLSSGITSRAWVLTGLCSRMAYELGLHELDRELIPGDVSSPQYVSEWIEREEKRRAWWCCYELDHLASTLTCRPYGLDRQRTDILLPVSDKDWYAGVPVASASLTQDPLMAWQSLVDCPNQSLRAWYLVNLHLVRLGHELRELDTARAQKDVQDYKLAVKYFSLALPPSFDICSGLTNTGSDFGWVISTHIMLQSCLLATTRHEMAMEINSPASNASSPAMIERLRDSGHSQTNEILSAIRAWAPKSMPFSPFLACAIVGPHAIHVENCLSGSSDVSNTSNDDFEMMKLCLKRHAWYWELGDLLLDIVQICSKRRVSELATLSVTEKETLKRVPLLAPSPIPGG